MKIRGRPDKEIGLGMQMGLGKEEGPCKEVGPVKGTGLGEEVCRPR